LTGEGFDASEDGTGRGTPLVPVHCRDIAGAITSNYGKQVDSSDTALGPNIIAFDTTQMTSAANRSQPKVGDPCHPLAAGAHAPAIAGQQVRRLTPRECERLQGFPDDYTAVPHRGKPAADGPRYKALGNSWAVPCARWIGQRINAVEQIATQELEAA
jgi:DNA (cytosine-5)-methyltransferase 1